jgi:hypothetical protein
MKEPFVNLGQLIEQAKLSGDMELQAYLASMSSSQQSEFTASNINDAITSVQNVKQQQFSNMVDQVVGADNSITSAAYYLARTSDLKDMTNDIDAVAAKQLSTSDINNNLVGRQYEINEWANFNKLDTLYFMQVLFICLSFISFVLFLKSNNYISHYLFTLLSFLSAVVAIFSLITRARYTNVVRDSRYWHKARFPSQPDPFPLSAKISCPGAITPPVVPPPPARGKCGQPIVPRAQMESGSF